jgi:cation diffusion facilitator CzcD-associated flavoprotein CzcO
MLDKESNRSTAHGSEEQAYDMIIIGAGFGGIRMLHEARQLGLSAKVLEAGSDVGGTWYWNRYPGARTDSEAWAYCFFFDKQLMEDYDWPERMPSWDQVLDYIGHVVDRFDMRKDIQFDTRVKSAIYDEVANKWRITTMAGETFACTHFVSAAGLLHIAYEPPFKGLDTFQGEWHMTSRWPKEDVDFRGKRVAIVGSGSTAVQILPIVAQSAAHVSMFQRTPNYVTPGRNHPIGKEQMRAIKDNYPAIVDQCQKQVFGFPMDPANRLFSNVSAEEAQRVFERGWEAGGFRFLFETFDDLLVNQEANDAAAEFIRGKIRAIVEDPETAELLCPDYSFAVKRPPTGNFFYETFNRDNVSLIDVKNDPITEITPTGIKTENRAFEFDIIIFALGFDAVTGALTHMDVRGRDGVTIKDKWDEGPQTNLGICVDGFPNMYIISGPQAPFANIPIIIENSVDWIGSAIKSTLDGGYDMFEAEPAAVAKWGEHMQNMLDATLLKAGYDVNAWYLGANIPGKKPAVLFYFGGAGAYFDEIHANRDNGFEGFAFKRHNAGAQPRTVAAG